jgi:hypothetical protein
VHIRSANRDAVEFPGFPSSEVLGYRRRCLRGLDFTLRQSYRRINDELVTALETADDSSGVRVARKVMPSYLILCRTSKSDSD